MTGPPPLVLASASPRRAAILRTLGLEPEVRPADVDESRRPGEAPDAFVERIARAKAAAVAADRPEALVIAGDTAVVLDDRVLGKPSDPDEAVEMLLALSGRPHTVATGTAVAAPGGGLRSRVDRAEVVFDDVTRAAALEYVATGEPLDKAGAYGIQGRGSALVTRVDGDYYTVVGLPVSGLRALLEASGWRYAFGRLAPLEGAG